MFFKNSWSLYELHFEIDTVFSPLFIDDSKNNQIFDLIINDDEVELSRVFTHFKKLVLNQYFTIKDYKLPKLL